MAGLILPGPEGLAPYTPGAASDFAAPGVPMTRIAFAAAHVVADPLADVDPWLTPAIDWEATLAYRHHLWEHGFAVAEAMDTAQRGMGLGWEEAQELIRRSVAEARGVPGASVFSGVGTDHLVPSPELGIDAIIAAYLEQLAAVQGAGGRVILMASRALAAAAQSAEDYARVYAAVLAEATEPVIIHWLGDMFDPALAGYWGSDDIPTAMNTCLAILKENAGKIDGIKISLLSKEAEIDMRRRLPDGVRMYTGDDFNYAELIEGDEHGYSDALLGIFDAIAPAASAALKHLAAGNADRFNEILAPTVPLSRHIFKAPTRFYKTGVVFLAWLNGHQSHFTMVGGQESTRSTLHLAELFRLADKAGLLTDPDRASARMADLMRTRGVA
ncbi:dihydrodipicolinate synthase family protein [Vannielia litorea]|uniref:dihydrodipicolinate synthase family protein n=1 Tax=Vannielia litorea TaxID=1217970 RepID=UPI001C97CDD2|nr:dihydrodipicolinate synthase family protein [Vannielia litorea]MBY6048437.1 dihydrodipicolinate synthase family protein [Vannielia litorea]MBY6075851.1 dihydrodipicolinate synthase family protein [Vannielia litorea]